MLLSSLVPRLLVVLLSAASASPAFADCEPPAGVADGRVIPLLRSRAFVESVREHQQQVLPVRWVNRELAVVFVEATLARLKYFRVPPAQAECWTSLAALQRAQRNLARGLGDIRIEEARPGVQALTGGGPYVSSLILAHRVLRQAIGERLDTMVVGVPQRDMLLIADPKDEAAVRELREAVAAAHAQGAHPVSDQLFRVSSCEIAVFDAAAPDAPPCR